MSAAGGLVGEPGLARSVVAGRPLAEGRLHAVDNPADPGRPVGQALHATPEIATRALDTAAAAADGWRAQGRDRRLALLGAALELVGACRELLARTITLENGKTLREARAEVDASLAEGRWQLAHLGRTPERAPVPVSAHGVSASVRHAPVGPCVLITPWNFPLATIVRKLVPALACGNTVVVKPSELAPLTAARLFELLAEAGLPPGAAQLVIGTGPELGPALTRHPALAAVSFTGSTATGRRLARALAGREVRLQAEMGGCNALLLLEDGDLDAAVQATVSAGFACAGQWCTATRRAIVAAPLYERFVQRLCERTAALRVGSGLDPETDMGPVISAAARGAIEAEVQAALAAGARLAHRHATLPVGPGHWSPPTVLADVGPDMALAREEVFGPVVGVLPAADLDEALRLAAATEYGLSFSVYTRDAASAERCLAAVPAGLCHVNLPTTFRDPALPLGGWGASGLGGPEGGDAARAFFTRPRAVYEAAEPSGAS